MSKTQDHEIVSIYPFTEAEIDALMAAALECVLIWSTRDGWPVGVIHAFVWHEGRQSPSGGLDRGVGIGRTPERRPRAHERRAALARPPAALMPRTAAGPGRSAPRPRVPA
jgi:hypothetical protein